MLPHTLQTATQLAEYGYEFYRPYHEFERGSIAQEEPITFAVSSHRSDKVD